MATAPHKPAKPVHEGDDLHHTSAQHPTQQSGEVNLLAPDPNGASSAADKEYFRRKQHGGTGA